MTLSQIIAKDHYYDINIPDKGHWDIWMKIVDGKVIHLKPTPDMREEAKSDIAGQSITDITKFKKLNRTGRY